MQQITPFTIVKKGDKYLTTIFKQYGFEKLSIGIGNNIEIQDGINQPLFNSTVRTLLENITVKELTPLIYVGTVRDQHKLPNYIGYVFLFNVIDDSIKFKDKFCYTTGDHSYFKKHEDNEILYEIKSEWLTIDELINKYGKLDSWTRHIVNYLVDSNF